MVVAPKIPGLTVPLDHYFNGKGTYPTALSTPADFNYGRGLRMDVIPLRELSILHLMNHITDKPGWDKKISKWRIVERWKEEILTKYHDTVTESMADWVFEELRYKAEVFEDTGAVSVFDIGVIKSDSAVEDELREELKAAAASLEDVPESERDYHPRSNKQVLNLVHPSLFPLVYGRTRAMAAVEQNLWREDCLRQCPTGKPIPVPPEIDSTCSIKTTRGSTTLSKVYSRKFQWLPCEVDVAEWRVKQCSIRSYINNLHPERHQDLYTVIEKIIARALPLWSMTLSPLEQNQHRLPRVGDYTLNCQWVKEKWLEGKTRDVPVYDLKIEDTKEFPDPENIRSFLDPEWYTRFKERMDSTGRLQIIVKLANIHLTPEKPEYAGGTWHVEGQMNEHICATALYYYSTHNITPSHLSFRQKFTETWIGRHDTGHDFLDAVYGIQDRGPAVQDIGSVLCTEGRLLTFPNILQHRVEPFALRDRNECGWRKILALFLVDSNVEVCSTAKVPPQQRGWWEEREGEEWLGGSFVELREDAEERVEERGDGCGLDELMDMKEAKQLRLELMDERSLYVETQENHFKGDGFNLCEH